MHTSEQTHTTARSPWEWYLTFRCRRMRTASWGETALQREKLRLISLEGCGYRKSSPERRMNRPYPLGAEENRINRGTLCESLMPLSGGKHLHEPGLGIPSSRTPY